VIQIVKEQEEAKQISKKYQKYLDDLALTVMRSLEDMKLKKKKDRKGGQGGDEGVLGCSSSEEDNLKKQELVKCRDEEERE